MKERLKNAILYANVGISDLGINGKPYFKKDENVYEKSKEIFNQNKWVNLKLEPLLLGPVVNYIDTTQDYKLQHIYLFATEQVPFHPQDTWYIAQILKKLLGENTSVIQINDNPADRDKMYEFYEKFFNKSFSADIYFVSLTGGTPAENEALLFNCVSKFRNLVQAIYLPAGSNQCKLLRVGDKIYKAFLTETYKSLKEKHQYKGAIELAEKYGLLDNKELERLRGEYYRYLFDFKKAITHYKKIKESYSGIEKSEIENIINNLEKLEKHSSVDQFSKDYFLLLIALLDELFNNILIKFEEGNYIDFLGRIVRFNEASLKFIFEYTTKISTEKGAKGFEEFKNYIEQNEELLESLQKDKINYSEPNTLVLRKVIGYLISKERDTKLKEIMKIVKSLGDKLDTLNEIRNKSILGHGFCGVSEDTIKEKYEGDIIEDLKSCLNSLKSLVS
ncbi:MAG: hypothetical protein QXE46_00800 [Candidatus Thermoplasmatota archaeon]